MADDSFAYCDSDEEIFIGKVTDKELLKRALLGNNYDSPAMQCSTPRPRAVDTPKKTFGNLPDVLKVSTNTSNDNKSEPPSDIVEGTKKSMQSSKHFPSANSSIGEDDDVIILDDSIQNDSVQIISDDESFVRNEELLGIKPHENEPLNESIISSNKETSVEVSKLEYGSFFSNQDMTIGENILQKSSFLPGEDFSLQTNSGNDSQSNSYLSNTAFDPMTTEELLLPDFPLVHMETETSNVDHGLPQECEAKTSDEISNHENINSVTIEALTQDSNDVSSQINIPHCDPLNQDFDSVNNMEEDSEHVSCIPLQHCEIIMSVDVTENNNLDSVSNKSSFQPSNDLSGLVNTSQTITPSQAFNSLESKKEEFENISDIASQEFETQASVDASTHENIDPISIDALIHASIQLENEYAAPGTVINKVNDEIFVNEKQLPDKSGLSDLDYSSLYAVSDSILNISHGSSLPSPINVDKKDMFSLGTNVLYEDISCDGEQMLENDDLHMSVDEPDIHKSDLLDNCSTSITMSQPSLFNSCPNTSSGNSFVTASEITTENISTSHLSNPFLKYRDCINSDVTQCLEEGIEIKENVSEMEINGDKNEANFEIVTQNRQNSFVVTPVGVSNVTQRTKLGSKLPVYQSSTNLLKPPKLNVKPEILKINSSFNWTKHLKQSNLSKENRNVQSLEKVNQKKNLTPCQSNSKSLLKPQLQTKKLGVSTPDIKSSSTLLNKVRTPVGKVQTSHSLLPRSETKTSKVLKCFSSEKKVEGKNLLPSSGSERYKHIISPIHTYITGSPSILQKKAQVTSEDTNSAKKKMSSHIPRKTPLKTPKAVQKLEYGTGQENVDPNYTRDTLPPRKLQEATAVFLKEPEETRHLPKIGGMMKKLLDTPRQKVIAHQGRVATTPKAKGVLIPSSTANSPLEQSGDISVRFVKTAEKTNSLK